MEYKIYLYKTRSKREIVEKFINKLDKTTQARTRNAIRLLREYGLELIKGPSVKKIFPSPPIYELRITGKKQVRLLFFQYGASVFVITNAFVKKTQKTPQKEIKKATSRAKEFI
jgi:phage-related protein